MSVSVTCPYGQTSTGVCVNGVCPFGSTCYGTLCCSTTVTGYCADRQPAIGFCNNGICSTGYTCYNNLCCPINQRTTGSAILSIQDVIAQDMSCIPCLVFCPNGQPATVPCVMGQCTFGSTCSTGNWCCPSSTTFSN